MNDELFSLPPSPADALAAARARYAAAKLALDEIEAEGADDLGVATEAAQRALAAAERELHRIELERLR